MFHPLRHHKLSGDSGRSDIFEGTTHLKNGTSGILKIKIEDSWKNLNLRKFQFKEEFKGQFGNALSLYHIEKKLFLRKSIHRIDKRMIEFGDTAILIFQAEEFIRRVEKKLFELGIKFDHCKVRYRNFSKIKDLKLNPFIKSHTLSFHHGYRIYIPTNKSEKLIIEIGSIEDIANIYSSEELIRMLEIIPVKS